MSTRRKRARTDRPRRRRRVPWRALLAVGLVGAVVAAAVLVVAWVEVASRFEGRLWRLPSRVYSDAPVLAAGMARPAAAAERHLERLGYVRVPAEPARPGQFARRGSTLDVHRRAFDFAGARFEADRFRVRFASDGVVSIADARGRRVERVVLEPELIATLHGPQQEDREVVRLAEVPETLLRAVLAAEDARFYEHPGIDARAVVRAALANLRRGRIVQGGSTITQQTVKNLYLGQERTWWRKLREAVMAPILDARFTKDRILEVYLNEVYLGQRGPVAICGVQAAARHYFGRDLGDLSVGEHALLAGMIRSPGRYNPRSSPERARARRDQVLASMVRLDLLSEDDAAAARAEPVLVSATPAGPRTRAPWAVDEVRARVSRAVPRRALTDQGLRVYTSIDPFLQDAAEDALRAGLERLDRDAPVVRRQRGERTLEGLIVALRPATGEILALVGGRDYGHSQFNRVTQAERQPGSLFKPFVYLAGFEAAVRGRARSLHPASILVDEPLEIRSGGRLWRPANYDRRFRGPVSVRQALESSLNVPTVRASEIVGLERVAEIARLCGLAREFRPLPSLALGAQEVTPLALASAYATLANSGLHVPPRILHEVTDLEGRPLGLAPEEPVRAVSPQAAYLLNNVLQGVVARGTGASAAAHGFRGAAAGKTGTTDDTRDSWFVGYTPDVLALVWVGYDDNARTGLTGASGALPVWADFMIRAGEAWGGPGFREPPGIVRRTIDPVSGGLAHPACPERRVEIFARGSEPREECTVHRPGLFRRLRDRMSRRPRGTV